ncbi:MAG: hypothetical protein NZ561_03180 [Phycisphaerae bacterium]|nr:hypothetical protein [Phycisphaerae bacterium]MDW8262891.1 hypothetical protein [Phycisphaerales bacterium]
MKLRRVGLFLLPCLALLGGCAAKAPPQPAPPATPQQLEQLRASLTSQRPGTIVGIVSAVLPEEKAALISDVPAEQFYINDLVSIVDSAENTLAFGRVVRRLENGRSVHVRYEQQPNARAPAEGDLAVRFPR